MKKILALVPFAALGFAAPTFAAGASFLDGYYVPSANIEIKNSGPMFDTDEEGDGFGVKGAFAIAPALFLTGEYQANEYEDANAELDTYRIGLGVGEGAGSGDGLYGRIEYLNADDGDDDESGFAGHLGFALSLIPELRLHAEAGYQKFDDLDGPEWLVGATFRLSPSVGLFVDYRATSLEVEDRDIEINYDEVRAGARFYF